MNTISRTVNKEAGRTSQGCYVKKSTTSKIHIGCCNCKSQILVQKEKTEVKEVISVSDSTSYPSSTQNANYTETVKLEDKPAGTTIDSEDSDSDSGESVTITDVINTKANKSYSVPEHANNSNYQQEAESNLPATEVEVSSSARNIPSSGMNPMEKFSSNQLDYNYLQQGAEPYKGHSLKNFADTSYVSETDEPLNLTLPEQTKMGNVSGSAVSSQYPYDYSQQGEQAYGSETGTYNNFDAAEPETPLNLTSEENTRLGSALGQNHYDYSNQSYRTGTWGDSELRNTEKLNNASSRGMFTTAGHCYNYSQQTYRTGTFIDNKLENNTYASNAKMSHNSAQVGMTTTERFSTYSGHNYNNYNDSYYSQQHVQTYRTTIYTNIVFNNAEESNQIKTGVTITTQSMSEYEEPQESHYNYSQESYETGSYAQTPYDNNFYASEPEMSCQPDMTPEETTPPENRPYSVHQDGQNYMTCTQYQQENQYCTTRTSQSTYQYSYQKIH